MNSSAFGNVVEPLVSIGVPVYNGEKGLALALDSLLCQNYKNLEIIISDNGSTDNTSDICKQYASKDSRITYYRFEENKGSIWNFNNVVKLSSGKYFMWAAHDDVRHPRFVETCVEKMEQSPEAVLCQTHTALYIVGNKEIISINDLKSFEDKKNLFLRYYETLQHFPATAIYGLFRLAVVKKTMLFQKSIATDLAFIQELSIHGIFIDLPEVLFSYIIRDKWNTIDQDYKVFFGKEKKPWWYSPFIMLFYSHFKRLFCSELTIISKIALIIILIEYEVEQVIKKIFVKTLGYLCPRNLKDEIGKLIYFKLICAKNTQVCCQNLYFERMIKPIIGWWR